MVAAWHAETFEFDGPVPAASTELVLGGGETGAYSFIGFADAGEKYKVRVYEAPLKGEVPEVGEEYWKDADRFSAATEVTIPNGPGVSGIDFSPSAYAFSSTRVAGADRYGTSVASTKVFAPGVPVLYVASGEKWADALSAAPAAAHQDGALLLTDPDALPTVVAAEITRLAPRKTIVVGSELTVSDAVYRQIDARVGDVTRTGGTDRYDTSRKIIDQAYEFTPIDFYEVFLATGNNFPDALSIAPVADHTAVLLVDGAKDHLDAATHASIARMHPYQANLIGQTPSISAGIEQDLVSSGLVPTTERIGGANRYETSRLINERYPSRGVRDTTYLASGEGFADALSGATAAAAEGVSISLSRPECVPAATVDSLKRAHIDTAKVLGSERTLSRTAGAVTPC